MKAIILLASLILIQFSLKAGEVTGAGKSIDTILKANNLSLQKLHAMGLELKKGEVTGAGKIHIDDLKMLVTKSEVHRMDEIQHIQFVNPSTAKLTEEVEYFQLPATKINKSKVIAFIISR